MKYDVLYNFISPITGRLCIPEDYILIGDGQGFSTPSPILIDMRLDLFNLRRDIDEVFATSFIIGFPNTDFPQAQVLSELEDGFMYNTAGVVSTSATIPLPVLPNLFYKAIWRGNLSGRPEPTEDLTKLELKVTFIEDVTIPAIEAEIAGLEAEIAGLQAEIVGLQAEIAGLQAEIAGLQAEIAGLQAEIGILDVAIVVIQIQLASLQAADNAIRNRLNALESDVATLNAQVGLLMAYVSTIQSQIVTIFSTLTNHNNRITILENQMIQVQQDIVDINFRIDNLEVTLDGDVTGSGNINSPIVTTLQLTLDEIKIAQDTVNLNDQKIINLKSNEVEQQDALNAKFLWDLMHDQVEVVWV